MGEKTATEKAIIEALQARDVWQRQKAREQSRSKSIEHGPSSTTPTTQIGFTKLSDMYGADEASLSSKYDTDRTNY